MCSSDLMNHHSHNQQQGVTANANGMQYMQQNSPYPSPPQSTQFTPSPQSVYNGSPPSTQASSNSPQTQVTSPNKQRPSLPTSPTHIAAMYGATQLKHGSQLILNGHCNGASNGNGVSNGVTNTAFDYPPPSVASVGSQSSGVSQYYPNGNTMAQYPTPPSHYSNGDQTSPYNHIDPENCLTPSPDSPYVHSSPHSNGGSEWPESPHSNVTVYYSTKTNQLNVSQVPLLFGGTPKGPEGVYI